MINKPESYCVVNAHKQDSISRGKVISYYLSFLIQCVLNQQANVYKIRAHHKQGGYFYCSQYMPYIRRRRTVLIYGVHVTLSFSLAHTYIIIVSSSEKA